jgi:hypothetical protein
VRAPDRTGQVWSFHLQCLDPPNVVWMVVGKPKRMRGAFVHPSVILFDVMAPHTAGDQVARYEHMRNAHELFNWEDSLGTRRIL